MGVVSKDLHPFYIGDIIPSSSKKKVKYDFEEASRFLTMFIDIAVQGGTNRYNNIIDEANKLVSSLIKPNDTQFPNRLLGDVYKQKHIRVIAIQVSMIKGIRGKSKKRDDLESNRKQFEILIMGMICQDLNFLLEKIQVGSYSDSDLPFRKAGAEFARNMKV